MDLLRRLFPQKSVPTGLFSFAFPQAPASLQNPEFLKAYKGWVYACVKRKADALATMELTFQEKRGDEWKESPNPTGRRALDVLATTNPFATSDGLYRGTGSFLDLLGNAFWYVAYNGRREPSELWQLDPTKVSVVRDERNYIRGWKYLTPKGREVTLSVQEVVPFQEFNPLDPFKGAGPTEAAALAIDTQQYRAQYARNFFSNSAVPSLIITTEQNLSQEQYDRFITNWLERFRGVANAHKPGLLEGKGVDVKQLSSTLKDMDLTSQNRETRDEILAVFGVPKALLGVVEDVNRANAEASEYVFAKYTVAPRMRFLATTLSEFYLPMWGLSPTRFRLWPVDAVPRNDELDLKRKESGLTHGYYTINEIRAEEGLKDVPDGDVVLVQSTMKPLDQVLNPPEPVLPAAGGDGAPKSKKALAKAPASDLVAGRVAFVRAQIRTARSKYEAVLADQRAHLVTKLRSREVPKSARKDLDETELSNELVRFLFSDWDEQIGLLLNPTRETLGTIHAEGGRRALAQLDVDQTFDQEHARAISWLETNALIDAETIADTLKGEVRDLIVQGVKGGKGATDIASDIERYYDERSTWKALRIARTEVIKGYAEGSLEGYRQSNVVKRKQWLSAGDANVEEECQANQDQGPILLDLDFESGHAAPPVHPNCRCVLQPVTD